MTETELKKCPFCGCETVAVSHVAAGWIAECMNCHSKTDALEYPNRAAEAWNTRAADFETCEWTKLVGGVYTTTCSELGVFRSGEFCPKCGKRIVVKGLEALPESRG